MGLHLSSAPKAILPQVVSWGAHAPPGLVDLGAVSCPWAALTLLRAWAVDDPAVAAPRRSLLMWGRSRNLLTPNTSWAQWGRSRSKEAPQREARKDSQKG